jgi:hypothetical protein
VKVVRTGCPQQPFAPAAGSVSGLARATARLNTLAVAWLNGALKETSGLHPPWCRPPITPTSRAGPPGVIVNQGAPEDPVGKLPQARVGNPSVVVVTPVQVSGKSFRPMA